jgi:hypothetical protein
MGQIFDHLHKNGAENCKILVDDSPLLPPKLHTVTARAFWRVREN